MSFPTACHKRLFGSLRIMQAISRKISYRNCYPHLYDVPQLKQITFCCLAYHFSLCSVFKVRRRQMLRIVRNHANVIAHSLRSVSFSSQTRFRWALLGAGFLSFELRLKYSSPLEYFNPFSNGFGGPEWARTTDLTIISRTL